MPHSHQEDDFGTALLKSFAAGLGPSLALRASKAKDKELSASRASVTQSRDLKNLRSTGSQEELDALVADLGGQQSSRIQSSIDQKSSQFKFDEEVLKQFARDTTQDLGVLQQKVRREQKATPKRKEAPVAERKRLQQPELDSNKTVLQKIRAENEAAIRGKGGTEEAVQEDLQDFDKEHAGFAEDADFPGIDKNTIEAIAAEQGDIVALQTLIGLLKGTGKPDTVDGRVLSGDLASIWDAQGTFSNVTGVGNVQQTLGGKTGDNPAEQVLKTRKFIAQKIGKPLVTVGMDRVEQYFRFNDLPVPKGLQPFLDRDLANRIKASEASIQRRTAEIFSENGGNLSGRKAFKQAIVEELGLEDSQISKEMFEVLVETPQAFERLLTAEEKKKFGFDKSSVVTRNFTDGSFNQYVDGRVVTKPWVEKLEDPTDGKSHSYVMDGAGNKMVDLGVTGSTTMKLELRKFERSTSGNIEDKIISGASQIAEVQDLISTFKPEFLTFGAGTKAGFQETLDKIPGVRDIPGTSTEFAEARGIWINAAQRQVLKFRKAITGLEGGEKEFEAILEALPNHGPSGDSPNVWEAKAEAMLKEKAKFVKAMIILRMQGIENPSAKLVKEIGNLTDEMKLVPDGSITLHKKGSAALHFNAPEDIDDLLDFMGIPEVNQ